MVNPKNLIGNEVGKTMKKQQQHQHQSLPQKIKVVPRKTNALIKTKKSTKSSPPLNPFLIDTVFLNIAKYLSYHQLVKCSIVCKNWMIMTDSILNDRIHFTTNDLQLPYTNQFLRYVYAVGQLTMDNVDINQERVLLFNILKSSKFQWLSVLYLQDCFVTPNPFMQLMKLIGHQLEVLGLKISERIGIFQESQIKNIFPIQVPVITKVPTLAIAATSSASIVGNTKGGTKLPGLITLSAAAKKSIDFSNLAAKKENLTFSKLKRLQFTSSVICSTNLNGIFTTFPKLVELQLAGDILTSFINMKITGKFDNLRELSIGRSGFWEITSDGILTQLTRLNLKLTTLELNDINAMARNISMFIDSLKNTLHTLRLLSSVRVGGPMNSNVDRIIPMSLPKLNFITISKRYIVNSINYTLAAMPSVTKVCLPFHPEETWHNVIVEDNTKITSVQQLILTSWIPPYILTQLGEMLPNLTCLRMDCTDDLLLPAIFREFKGLKFLRVGSRVNGVSAMTDAGFAVFGGETEEAVPVFTGETLNFLQINSYLLEMEGQCLADLKDLEKLTIICSKSDDVTEITLLNEIPKLSKLIQLMIIGLKFQPDAIEKFQSKTGFKLAEKKLNSLPSDITSYVFERAIITTAPKAAAAKEIGNPQK